MPTLGIASSGLEAMPTRPEDGAPYISVVVAARNDNHGGNMLGRMQAFIDSWMGLSQQYELSSEIIVVEWNPPANRPRLRDALRWPAGPQACQVRFIEVPPEIHWRFQNADAIPLHQMIAKNAGIRRARGEFVLATNLDIVFSAELMRFLAERRLERHTLYRMDRHDVADAIPTQSTVQELLAFCARNVLRVFRSEGAFELASDGLPIPEEKDIVHPDSGIRLGSGWYPVESYSRGLLRWTSNGAEIFVQRLPGSASQLLIDAETGPSAGGEPVTIEVVDPAGTLLASARVEGRCQLRLHIPEHISSAALGLRVYSRGLPLTRDSRFLSLCVFGLRWDSPDCLSKPDWVARRVRIAFNPEPGSKLESFEINLTDASANVIFHATTEQIRTLGVGEHVVTLDLGFQPQAEAGWLLEVTNNIEAATGWAFSQEAASPFARYMHRPAFLHSNACGDFTLLARDDWHAMRGYAEFPIWPMHLDTLLCYAAHHAGLREVVLREPMRLFHIEHFSGAGWTPEGETARSSRIQSKGVDVVPNSDFMAWIHQMRKFNAPMIFALGNWGLAEVPLPETTV